MNGQDERADADLYDWPSADATGGKGVRSISVLLDWLVFGSLVACILVLGFSTGGPGGPFLVGLVLISLVCFPIYLIWKLDRPRYVDFLDGPYPSVWTAYAQPMAVAFWQQLIVIAFIAFVLGGGFLLLISLWATGGSWSFTLMALIRRPRTPTPVDVWLVKYGFWPCVLIVILEVAALVEVWQWWDPGR